MFDTKVCGLGPAKPLMWSERLILLGQMAHSWLKEQEICLKTLTCTSIYQEQKNMTVSLLYVVDLQFKYEGFS